MTPVDRREEHVKVKGDTATSQLESLHKREERLDIRPAEPAVAELLGEVRFLPLQWPQPSRTRRQLPLDPHPQLHPPLHPLQLFQIVLIRVGRPRMRLVPMQRVHVRLAACFLYLLEEMFEIFAGCSEGGEDAVEFGDEAGADALGEDDA